MKGKRRHTPDGKALDWDVIRDYADRPQETREEELARRRREGRVIWMLGVEITGAEADAISADGP